MLSAFSTRSERESAIAFLERKAGHGNEKARFNLAVATMIGKYKKYTKRQAFKTFLKSAAANHPEAMFNVGRSYLEGAGIEKDLLQARRWMRRAAKLNYPEALFCLGLINDERGQIKRAFRYYGKAAKYGSIDGLFNLAWCYDTGSGVKADPRSAVRLYQKLLRKVDDPSAHFNLAQALIQGRGARQSLQRARTHLKMAAAKGHSRAKKLLRTLR